MINKEKFFQKIRYVPHDKQRAFHDSKHRYRVIAAGARAGKSMAAGAEIAFLLFALPGARVWCVATQYELADKEFDWMLRFVERVYVGSGISILNYCDVSSAARGSRQITMPWGSYCKTKSTEKPTSLLGEELDLLVMCEASQIAREPYERMLRARISSRCGGIIACSTPNGDGGLFKEFFENGQSNMLAEWKSWQFSTLDNPTFQKSEWEKAKSELAEEVFKEQFGGEFVSRRGRVFAFTNASIVGVLPSGYENWPVLVGIQRGYQNPFSVVFVALSPTREYYVIDEVYMMHSLFDDVLMQVRERMKGRRILATVADFKDVECQSLLRNAGIACTFNDERKISKTMAIIKRVQALQNVLKVREDGTSKLRVFSQCTNLVKELTECKWPDRQAEMKEKSEIEIPLSKYFQSPSALSYVISFFELSQGVSVYA